MIVLCLLYIKNTKYTPIKTNINPDQPMLAITFDDGPNAQYTPAILAILSEEQAYATFFLIGSHIDSNKEIVQAIVSANHEIASHTYVHPNLLSLNKQKLLLEVKKNKQKIRQYTKQDTIYFRPPYGAFNEQIIEWIQDPIVLWQIDSSDWKTDEVEPIYNHVMNQVKDGDIIIFHDDNPTTVEVIKKLIPALKKQHYQFVTISTLQQYRENDKIYK